jgi:hypothetical protein
LETSESTNNQSKVAHLDSAPPLLAGKIFDGLFGPGVGFGAGLGCLYGILHIPARLLLDPTFSSPDPLWYIPSSWGVFGLPQWIGLSTLIGLVWGVVLGLLQFLLLVGLERLQLASQSDPLLHRAMVGIASVTLSMALTGIASLFWRGDLSWILDYKYFLFLPNLVMAITFAILASKTVTWVSRERQIALSSRAPSAEGDMPQNKQAPIDTHSAC